MQPRAGLLRGKVGQGGILLVNGSEAHQLLAHQPFLKVLGGSAVEPSADDRRGLNTGEEQIGREVRGHGAVPVRR